MGTLAAPRKHSLHFILSPAAMARDAPDVPGVTSPKGVTGTPVASAAATTVRRPSLTSLPADVLGMIAYHVVVQDNHAGRPSRLLPLLKTNRTLHSALNFDANPVLYNRLFRATFDLGALVRRTQWMFDVNTDIPGTSRKTELFANPRSWAMEYRDRWELRNRIRACIAHQSVNVPGMSNRENRDTDMWGLWFLWTENDEKNIIFLTEECHFHEWIICYYKDDMLKDSLKSGYPRDTAVKALGIWTALLSGSDLLSERSAAQIDDKIFMLRPYIFSPSYELTYGPWEHRRLPLCDTGCTEHAPISHYAAPYKRFGHKHMRAPPHFVLGAYLVFMRLLERQPGRVGLKSDSTVFQDTGRGVFSLTHIMSSLYHDTEWQRNTVCQDPHTSPGLPPLTFHGRLTGFWRGNLLFYDFDAYRQMLSGNMRSLYTGTFAQHAVELDLHETVIRIRAEDVGGKGSLLNCGFADEETEEEQALIKDGYGHQVLTGDAIYAREAPGWTKEILLSGGCRSAWGWSRIRGRVRAWDGLVTLSIGHSRPYPCGQWVWRGYLQTGGYFVGRWRDCFTPETQAGYEGPFGLVRAGDLFYPPHFPTTMNASAGVTKLDFGPNGPNNNVWPGPAPGGVHVRGRSSTPRPYSSHSHSSRSSHGSSQPQNGHAYAGAGGGAAAPRPLANGHSHVHAHVHAHAHAHAHHAHHAHAHNHAYPSGRSWASSPASTPSDSDHGSGSRQSSALSKRKYSEDDYDERERERERDREREYEYRAGAPDDRRRRRDYD